MKHLPLGTEKIGSHLFGMLTLRSAVGFRTVGMTVKRYGRRTVQLLLTVSQIRAWVRAERLNTQSNKNPSAWYFVRPA